MSSDSRATKAASWNAPNNGSPPSFFPSEYDSGWQKEHGRLQRTQLQRISVTPEEAGLCGCAQFVVVQRERQHLRRGQVVATAHELSYYVTSLTAPEADAATLASLISGHWNACENGAHYRRDVTLGEDACQISGRTGAHALATLRNLVLGLFELQRERGQTAAKHLPEWRRQLTFAQAIKLIKGG
jgi:hypothetical protein